MLQRYGQQLAAGGIAPQDIEYVQNQRVALV